MTSEDQLCQQIKSLGLTNDDDDDRESRVKESVSTITRLCDENEQKQRVVRAGCHALSNIAMALSNCESMLKEGIFEWIFSVIRKQYHDWRVCWLSCSTIWNLARSRSARDQIGSVSGISVILRVMKLHKSSSLVMQTALGALSNLCIDPQVKQQLGNAQFVRRILQIMEQHRFDSKVLTSACGLLTNLAYEEAIALTLADCHVVPLVVQCMRLHPSDSHLQRNGSASLSNLSATDPFITQLCMSNGVEVLFDAVHNHADDFDVLQLTRGALNNIAVYERTSSLHVAASFSDVSTVRSVMFNAYTIQHHDSLALDTRDRYGDTPLHSAVRAYVEAATTPGVSLVSNSPNQAAVNTAQSKRQCESNLKMHSRLDVIQTLVSSGADPQSRNDSGQTPSKCATVALKQHEHAQLIQDRLNKAIHNGQRHVRNVRRKMSQLLCTHNSRLPREIAQVIAEYSHPLDVSVSFRIENEPCFGLTYLRDSGQLSGSRASDDHTRTHTTSSMNIYAVSESDSL